MAKKNIFAGFGLRSEFVNLIYRELMKRKFLTYADVLTLYYGRPEGYYNKMACNSEPIYKEEIVLIENDNHRIYSEVFDWSNVEQLRALTRCTCFFAGLSLKDPNLRRLLEIA